TGRTRPSRRRAHSASRKPRPAEPPDRARRRRARPRTAVRPPKRRGRDRAEHGPRDRAGHLLARGRRPSGRGQLPRDARRAGAALLVPRRLPMTDQIWTGEINEGAKIDAEVGFYDTT